MQFSPRLVKILTIKYNATSTLAQHGKMPSLAAYDSGNLLSVASSVHERWPDKTIIIAGDDDHRIENNPGREKALAAAEAVAGVAIFPKFSGEHRLWGFTDFNDLASEEPRLVTLQVEEFFKGLGKKARRQHKESSWRARPKNQWRMPVLC